MKGKTPHPQNPPRPSRQSMVIGQQPLLPTRTNVTKNHLLTFLSSPRAKGLRTVPGRRCPHSGKGEDFLSRQQDFFTETAVTSERKVEKSFPRWEINRHAKG